MPGFGPAAELVACRVPKGAPVVVEAKGPKTIDAQSGLIALDGRMPYRSAGQLATLRQGPSVHTSAHPQDLTAGDGQKNTKAPRTWRNQECLGTYLELL